MKKYLLFTALALSSAVCVASERTNDEPDQVVTAQQKLGRIYQAGWNDETESQRASSYAKDKEWYLKATEQAERLREAPRIRIIEACRALSAEVSAEEKARIMELVIALAIEDVEIMELVTALAIEDVEQEHAEQE